MGLTAALRHMFGYISYPGSTGILAVLLVSSAILLKGDEMTGEVARRSKCYDTSSYSAIL